MGTEGKKETFENSDQYFDKKHFDKVPENIRCKILNVLQSWVSLAFSDLDLEFKMFS